MALKRLSELDDWKVSDQDYDIRGSQLRDRDRNALGTIDDLVVDTDKEYVTELILDNGEQISADHIDIKDDGVFLTRGHTAASSERPSRVRIYGKSGGRTSTRPSP